MDVKAISQGGQIASNGTQNANSVPNSSKQTDESSSYEKNSDKEVTEKQVREVVDKLNKLIGENDTHVEYEVHKGLCNIAIKIVDNFSKEVKWQVPAERVVKAMDDLYDSIGLMFDKKG